MTKKDKKDSSRRLKNANAQLKRRNETIAKLKEQIAELKEEIAELKEAQKKTPNPPMDQVLQNIQEQFRDTSSRCSSSSTQSFSEAKQTAALEILSKLLKD